MCQRGRAGMRHGRKKKKKKPHTSKLIVKYEIVLQQGRY